jgi:hypothetical protein
MKTCISLILACLFASLIPSTAVAQDATTGETAWATIHAKVYAPASPCTQAGGSVACGQLLRSLLPEMLRANTLITRDLQAETKRAVADVVASPMCGGKDPTACVPGSVCTRPPPSPCADAILARTNAVLKAHLDAELVESGCGDHWVPHRGSLIAMANGRLAQGSACPQPIANAPPSTSSPPPKTPPSSTTTTCRGWPAGCGVTKTCTRKNPKSGRTETCVPDPDYSEDPHPPCPSSCAL